MNVAKFYRKEGASTKVVRIPISGNNKYGAPTVRAIANVEEAMLRRGFTRRRPANLGPHHHAAQQPGFHQPSARARRRAKQLLGRKARAA